MLTSIFKNPKLNNFKPILFLLLMLASHCVLNKQAPPDQPPGTHIDHRTKPYLLSCSFTYYIQLTMKCVNIHVYVSFVVFHAKKAVYM